MGKKNPQKASIEDLIRDQMIIQLVLAGVGQLQIREIVGVNVHRVSRIAQLMKVKKGKG